MPIYVTEEDEENEKYLASLFQIHYEGLRDKSAIFKKENKLNQLDYSVYVDNICVAWVEMRMRQNPMHKYRTIYCDLDKYEYAKKRYENFGTNCIFLVGWSCNCVGFIDFKDVDCKDPQTLVYQGVDYRDNKNDLGTVIQIPVSDFILIQHGAKTN